jgi:hypothetical protein
MKQLIFHVDQLSERGTSTAVYEYARIIRELNMQASITYPIESDLSGLNLFKNEFELIPYKNFTELKYNSRNFDLAYFLKYGTNDKKLIPGIPNFVQAVFPTFHPHGTKYFYVSQWLAEYMKNKHKNSLRGRISKFRGTINATDFDYLDHCVDMPKPNEDIRAIYGIPNDAIVGIRYGGYKTFDLPWIKKWIVEELERNADFWFIAINTEKFFHHKRLLNLPAEIGKQNKANLVGAADFFLHARAQGETFGMSIVESLQVNTPVFAWRGGEDLNHLTLLPDEFLYDHDTSLSELLIKRKSNYENFELFSIAEEFRPKNIGPKLKNLLLN